MHKRAREIIEPGVPEVKVFAELHAAAADAADPALFIAEDLHRVGEYLEDDAFFLGVADFFDARGHLKIIDRAKDVGRLAGGALFAPKYLENRIKFFPEVREAVAFGQDRALVVWQRLIRPDGSSVLIDNLPATDTSGYAGLADSIDLHTFKLLQGVALATVLGVGTELALGASDNSLVKALQQAAQTAGNRAGQRLIERQLDVRPTLTVRPGWPLRVIVHKDIVLAPYADPANP